MMKIKRFRMTVEPSCVDPERAKTFRVDVIPEVGPGLHGEQTISNECLENHMQSMLERYLRETIRRLQYYEENAEVKGG